MTEDLHTRQDPTRQYPQPEYPEQTQMDQHPGLDQICSPSPITASRPTGGAASWKRKKAVITGGDSV